MLPQFRGTLLQAGTNRPCSAAKTEGSTYRADFRNIRGSGLQEFTATLLVFTAGSEI